MITVPQLKGRYINEKEFLSSTSSNITQKLININLVRQLSIIN